MTHQFCTSCGHSAAVNTRFCENCGAIFEKAGVPHINAGPMTHGEVVKQVRSAISSWVVPFNATLLFSTTLIAVFDFLSPRIALLPIAATLAVAGLLTVIALRRFVAPSLPPGSALRRVLAPGMNLHQSPALIATGVLSALMMTGAAWSSASSAGGGVIASKFDAARNAQMQLGVMHGLQKEQRVQTAVLEDIRDGRTSNPRRELANQGILWTEESYNSVLRSRDLPAVTLFLAGGMRWRIRDAQPFLNASDDEAAKLFLNYPAQGDQARGCEGLMRSLVRPTNETRTLPPAGQKPHSLSDMERRYLKAFCTQPESRTAAAAMLKQYQQSRQQAADEFKRLQDAVVPQKQCEQQAMAQDGHALFSEAASFNIMGPATYTSRQELLATFNIALITGSGQLTPKLVEAVRKYCAIQATPRASAGLADVEVIGMQQVVDALQ